MVTLYLVRHGIAEEARAGLRDEDRALTAEGVKKMRKVARAFCLQVGEREVSHVLSSPLLRARQTAVILAGALKDEKRDAEVIIEHSLASGDLRQFLRSVRALQHARGVVAAGHEPIMGHWIGRLCFGKAGRVHVKKGAVAAIELSKGSKGELHWLIQPGNWEAGR